MSLDPNIFISSRIAEVKSLQLFISSLIYALCSILIFFKKPDGLDNSYILLVSSLYLVRLMLRGYSNSLEIAIFATAVFIFLIPSVAIEYIHSIDTYSYTFIVRTAENRIMGRLILIMGSVG
jgi:hypothetical protein